MKVCMERNLHANRKFVHNKMKFVQISFLDERDRALTSCQLVLFPIQIVLDERLFHMLLSSISRNKFQEKISSS